MHLQHRTSTGARTTARSSRSRRAADAAAPATAPATATALVSPRVGMPFFLAGSPAQLDDSLALTLPSLWSAPLVLRQVWRSAVWFSQVPFCLAGLGLAGRFLLRALATSTLRGRSSWREWPGLGQRLGGGFPQVAGLGGLFVGAALGSGTAVAAFIRRARHRRRFVPAQAPLVLLATTGSGRSGGRCWPACGAVLARSVRRGHDSRSRCFAPSAARRRPVSSSWRRISSA